jgi:hypothetical protein
MHLRIALLGLLTVSLGCRTNERLPGDAGAAATPDASTATPEGSAATPGNSQLAPVTMNLCAGASAREQDRAWKTPLLTSMARLLNGALSEGTTVKLKVGECPADFREGTCYASPGFLACREDSVARLLEAAAWGGALSAVALRRHAAARAWYGVMATVGGGDLFELVSTAPDAIPGLASKWATEGTWRAEEILGARALVEKIHNFESNGTAPASPDETVAEAVYQTTAGHLVSFVIGHELSHYNSDRCAFPEPSLVEGEGMIDPLRALQEPGAPLCSSITIGGKEWIMTPRLQELLADKCALRGMARLERRTFGKAWGELETGGPKPALSFVARRLVVDILAWLLAYGPIPTGRADFGDNGNPAAIRASLLPGYLYPQHRLALVAAELTRHVSPQVVRPIICEDAARVFALQARASASVCRPGEVAQVKHAEQQLVPALGSVIAPGIAKLWQTGGEWDQQRSFRCEPPP